MSIRDKFEELVSEGVALIIVHGAGCVPSDDELDQIEQIKNPVKPTYNSKPQSHTLASSDIHNEPQMRLDEDPVRQNLYK